jgi:hypothetical protein
MGILDTIQSNERHSQLQGFDPAAIVSRILEPLKERERTILAKRYGLQGNQVATLESIGKQHGLTRERVRQIEKALVKQLKKTLPEHEHFTAARDLLVTTITEHGGAIAEERLLTFLGLGTDEAGNATRFLLNLVVEVEQIAKDPEIKTAWVTVSFNKDILKKFVAQTKALLKNHGKPIKPEDFLASFKQTEVYKSNVGHLNDAVVLNFLHAASEIRKNPFGEFGLQHWNEIQPKDVGDKAYVVMKHHGQPEHYSTITGLINKHHFDKRTAYKETVHNELIKDPRFILVGRGMYALAEWGYRPGVVSDVIKQVIREHKKPMTRDAIIQAVLKHRLVKKNTILVGLSNKKLFKKIDKNLYDLA